MQHPNLHIQTCTQSILEIKDSLDSTAKCVIDEIEKRVGKSSPHLKRDGFTKKKEETEKAKEVRLVGSFLNRKSVNTKPVFNKPSERDEKKTLIPPEPDSQVSNVYYVCCQVMYFYKSHNFSYKKYTQRFLHMCPNLFLGLCIYKNRLEI